MTLPRPLRIVWRSVRRALEQFVEDEVLTRGAALAFYAALSLAPVMLMFVAITGLVIDAPQQQAMVQELEATVGPQGAAAIHNVLDHARLQRGAGWFSFIISIVMLLFGATAVFVQLQWTMNRIWGVEIKSRGVIWLWVQKRLLSLAIMAVLGLLLLLSLALTAAITALIPPDAAALWRIIDWGLSVVIFTLLFAGMFKLLPDAKVAWLPVLIGAAVTAVLFAVGIWVIGIYLGASTFASAYGAAGSLIALLLWVYYSSILFFFGAELTEALTREMGNPIQPDPYAIRSPHPHHGEPA